MTKKSSSQSRKAPPKLSLAGTAANTGKKEWSVDKIWTPKLGKPFTPISSYFLENYHRLRYPITPVELTVIIHLLKHKWDDAMPYPAIATVARKMGRSEQAVRNSMRSLEGKGYLVRHMTSGRPNHFDLQPLFDAVEVLYDADKENPKTKRSKKKKTLSRVSPSKNPATGVC